jgi:hypothetical protein
VSLPPRRRRLLDRSLAVVLALVVAVIGLLVYRSSDIRNASLAVTPSSAPSGAWAAASVSSPTTAVPTALVQKWSAATDPALGAVASPSGVVVTTDQHSVSAHDAVTGLVRWTYSRTNRSLCAVGSSDIGPADMSSQSTVPGIVTVFEENGFCSQVSTFDPANGARGNVRTSPGQTGGSLVFGGSYGGWLGPTRLEVWRYDLVRTIQYGDQANPPKPNQSRLGCTFTDMAVATTQFATIEHCPAEGDTARLVINFDDPGAVSGHPDGWDVWQHTARTCVPVADKGCADIDTKAAAARIVGITADRVAVLVSAPTPAVVVYDATGAETSRTPVDIPATAIAAADDVATPARITPSVSTADQRFSLIGTTVLAVSMPTVQTVAPKTSFSAAPTTTTSSSSITAALSPSSAPAQVDVADLKLDWFAPGVRGLPATVGANLLLPTAKGLAVVDATNGPSALGVDAARTIAVDRAGYTGRVDVDAVGKMIIEQRGPTVVGLG